MSKGLSLAFDLLAALRVAVGTDLSLPASAPVGWANLLVVGTFFVMREIEIAFAKVAHITINHEARKVTLLLPVSKKDPRALGCERSWA